MMENPTGRGTSWCTGVVHKAVKKGPGSRTVFLHILHSKYLIVAVGILIWGRWGTPI